tara:strand:- start:6186 stop:6599 length:414 start_codon:yes stop_codon:yes gene_type:complete
MIWLLTALSLAEPLMTPLDKGEVAPFAGRLFNEEAVVSIITMKEYAEEQCTINSALDFSLQLAEKQHQIDYLDIEKQALQAKYDAMIDIKNEEIEVLRRNSNTKRQTWVFFGGFVLGTSASLLTYYAVNEIQVTTHD